MKIGLAVIAYMRPDYLEQCLTSLDNNNWGGATERVVCIDFKDIDMSEKLQAICQKHGVMCLAQLTNKGVAHNKNTALVHMMNADCEHLFLMEDDIIMKDPNTCIKYIKYAEKMQIEHMNFAHHGPANKGFELVWDLKQGPMTVYPNCVGAFSYYTRNCIDKVGLFDENFKNVWEHCLAGDTKVLTKWGWRYIADLCDDTVEVMTNSGQWVKAPITSFGEQKTNTISLVKKGRRLTIQATPEHTWVLSSGTKTNKLKVGDTLKQVFGRRHASLSLDRVGAMHGIVKGDGNLDRKCAQVSLYKDKRELAWLFEGYPKSNRRCEGVRFNCLPAWMKYDHPSVGENMPDTQAYMLSYLAGYFATDGSVSKAGIASMTSVTYSDLDMFRDLCGILGIECGEPKEYTQKTSYNPGVKYYKMSFNVTHVPEWFWLRAKHKERALQIKEEQKCLWTVESITEGIEQEVFCATVEKKHTFVIEGNILTGNCEHTDRIIKAELHPPFWYFVDYPASKKLLEEIPGSIENSTIRPTQDWLDNRIQGQIYWKKKHGEFLPDFPYKDWQ